MDHSGHGSTPSTNGTDHSTALMMMKTYLHFTPGDAVLFDTVIPTSPGAVFGACIVLFFLSVFGRWIHAFKRGSELRSKLRSKTLIQQYGSTDEETTKVHNEPHARFILSHEVIRSTIVALETLLHYILMLVVMTFNASYIISIVIGTFAGELVFGRLYR